MSHKITAKDYGADAPARCNAHKGTLKMPKGCKTCQRIGVERAIVRRVVRDLLDAGFELGTDAEGEDEKPRTTKQAQILPRLMQVDDEHLLIFKPGRTDNDPRPDSWVRFVYGNDGYDVISDYTTDLDDVLKGSLALSDEYGEGA